VPLYVQLSGALRDAVHRGRLPPGTCLPSSRSLAADLSLGRNTVINAYDQLVAEGYLAAVVGAGTRVTNLPKGALSASSRSLRTGRGNLSPGPSLSERGKEIGATGRVSAKPGRRAFQTGLPALDEFPFALWARLVASAIRRPDPSILGYHHSGGYRPLREAIASHLRSTRGVQCTADQVIVVTGAQAALDIAARMILDPGANVWIEDPGYLGTRGALRAAGARLLPVPVDEEGMDIEHGRACHPPPRLICLTPSCQFPLGITTTLSRRLALIEWANQADAWILEDDYDSEYRYEGRPLSALQGLDSNGRVIYAGTFSKTMFPALRVAYLVVPDRCVDDFRTAIRHTGQEAPLPLQAALAEFIDRGHYAAHLRRMRRLYAQRQHRFVELCEQHLAGYVSLPPRDAGMQLVAYFEHPVDRERLLAEADAQGVTLSTLGPLHLDACRRDGLFLGYAGVPEGEMETAVRIVARAFERQRRAPRD
jgi:GntR family transcriptional regulator/MocR family aminotransferase